MQQINHSQMVISSAEIVARRAHTLHRVTVFAPALCHVRQGTKLVQWGAQAASAGQSSLILFPAGAEVSIANTPDRGHYCSDMVYLPQSLLRQFRHWYGALAVTPVPTASLCVPLDIHTRLAWDSLLLNVKSHAPDALLQHAAMAVLLALYLAGQAGVLLIDRRDKWAEQVQQVLLLDPARNWSVSDVARSLHIGDSTLRRKLMQEDRSFRMILEEVRMGCALHALQTTSLSIGEIAAQHGYISPSRFTSRFQQHFGLTPRRLREAITTA
ncbi:helix-turn-helix transcriptional regulator [Yersinia intermedia]|uniref:helix-turn-helix transcriptional regulator n=1 Tax=Yersinia intermedia TaxID=631 RepID=UPI0005E5E154|nr:helix-turn-helix transcriptional regulator [Yersinia intermedia]MCB5310980.1 helix-turn-helix transcriptional regulator [Yersinia intermedia]MCB5326753.1 helix-turn-helix transcriptional regulator [Yersinia intermedia]CNB20553.1 AraC family transcriptional regulator [Yersinia intermedia]CRE44214.1 AraC family transcriptional regulator [Yersinia intermedia]